MTRTKIKNILSIAGSDPSGGAGIQADLKTIAALGGYGMAALTALTAQNTQGVTGAQVVDASFIKAQLDAIFTDVRVDAVKIGMLGDEYAAQCVADMLEQYRPPIIVLDPVIVSTSGHRLTSQAAIEVIQNRLAPIATLVTPNIPESEVFLRGAVLEVERAGENLVQIFGGAPVLLKGGHAKSDKVEDWLFLKGEKHLFETDRIDTKNTHGTGCTLSSALATLLAQGQSVPEAVQGAQSYVWQAIYHAGILDVGSGHGPLCHNYQTIEGRDV